MFRKISIVLLIIMGINYIPIFCYHFFGDGEYYNTLYYLCSFLTLWVLEICLYLHIPFKKIIDKTLMFFWCIASGVDILDFLLSWEMKTSYSQIIILSAIIFFFFIKKSDYELKDYKSDKINDSDVFYVFYKPKDFFSLSMAVLGGFMYSGSMMYHNGYVRRFKKGRGYVKIKHSGVFNNNFTIKKSSNPKEALRQSDIRLRFKTKWHILKNNCYSPIRNAEGIDSKAPYTIFKECYNS